MPTRPSTLPIIGTYLRWTTIPPVGGVLSRRRGSRAAGAVLLTLSLALFGVSCSGAEAGAPPVAAGAPAGDELVVRRGDLTRTLLLTGELRAERAVDLVVPRTPTWRLQVRWLAEDGTEVDAGERVVEFDSTEFSGDLEERKLSLREKQNELERQRAQGQVTEAEKRFAIERARVELEKAASRADVPPDLLSEREYQERQLALRRAEVELEKAQEELEAALESQRADLAIQRIEIETARREIEAAERAVDDMTLTAPEAGIFVVQEHMWEPRKIREGDMVHVGMAVARLPDLSTMEVEASLSDVDDGRVRPGMDATCTLDAHPDRSYPCEVTSVSPVAQESNRSSLLRFFEVHLALGRQDPEVLRPGMSVKVEVVTDRLSDVLLVPRAALAEAQEPARARLASGGWAEVELEACGALLCAVASGPEEGTRLARAPEVDAAGADDPLAVAAAVTGVATGDEG